LELGYEFGIECYKYSMPLGILSAPTCEKNLTEFISFRSKSWSKKDPS